MNVKLRKLRGAVASKITGKSILNIFLSYLVLCVACGAAFPMSLVYAFFIPVIGLMASPLFVIDALRYEVFILPVLLTAAVYLVGMATVFRKVEATKEILVASAGSAVVAYLFFAVAVETSWHWNMSRDANERGFEITHVDNPLVLRLRSASLAFHSDGKTYYSPHAVARKDNKNYIWSFSENKFVP